MKKLPLLLALLLPACGPSDAPKAASDKPAAPAPPAQSTPPAPATPAPAPKPKPDPSAEAPLDAADLDSLTRHYFAWLQEGKWEDIAEIFHPDSLVEFRSIMDFLETADRHPGVIQMRALIFGPDTTAEKVTAMTDKVIFSKVMSVLMKNPQTAATLGDRTLDVVGWVPDGDSFMHVVTRSKSSAPGGEFEIMEVVSYKKDGDSWKILMTGRMKNNIQKVRGRFESLPGGLPPQAR